MTWGEGSTMAMAGVIVGSVGRELPTFILEKIFGRKKNGNGNGAAVTDAINHVQVVSILNSHTEILRSVASSNAHIERGIVELITIQRERRE